MERSTMLFIGKSTITMAIFNSYVSLPEGNMITTLVNFEKFRATTWCFVGRYDTCFHSEDFSHGQEKYPGHTGENLGIPKRLSKKHGWFMYVLKA